MLFKAKNNVLAFVGTFLIALLTILGVTNVQAQESDKTYIIGMDQTMAPFTYLDESGDPSGMEIEIFEAIAEDQGFNYEYRNFSFSAALQALQSNQIDGMLAGVAITPEREKQLDYSNIMFSFGNQIAVRADSDIEDMEDMYGKTIAVKAGSTGFEVIQDMQDEYSFEILMFESSADMHHSVNNGIADAAVESSAVQAYGIATGQLDFKQIGERLTNSDLAFPVNKGENPELLAMFNAGLEKLRADGTFEEIVSKYLGVDAAAEQSQSGQNALEEDTSRESDSDEPTPYSTAGSVAKALGSGLWTTIWVAFISIMIASVIGLIFGLMRVSENRILKFLADIYIYSMRGIPMIVFVFFIFFGVSQMLNTNFTPAFAGVTALSINTGAYIAEIVRGGIQGVHKGQTEAARSLGMSSSLTMRKIILPQAFRNMIPSLVNQFILALKNTSILSVIGMVELTNQGKIIIARTYRSGQTWFLVGFIYIVLITILTLISERLEKNLKNSSTSTEIDVKEI